MPKTKHFTHCPNSPKIVCPKYPVTKNALGEFGHRQQKILNTEFIAQKTQKTSLSITT